MLLAKASGPDKMQARIILIMAYRIMFLISALSEQKKAKVLVEIHLTMMVCLEDIVKERH